MVVVFYYNYPSYVLYIAIEKLKSFNFFNAYKYMNSILVKIIDNLVIQSRTNPRGRRPAATTEHYLKQIMSVLRSGMQWYHLKSDLHYTTYHKTHMKWCKISLEDLRFMN